MTAVLTLTVEIESSEGGKETQKVTEQAVALAIRDTLVNVVDLVSSESSENIMCRSNFFAYKWPYPNRDATRAALSKELLNDKEYPGFRNSLDKFLKAGHSKTDAIREAIALYHPARRFDDTLVAAVETELRPRPGPRPTP